MMKTSRDSKGRFAKKCKIKTAKDAIKSWVETNRDAIVSAAVVVVFLFSACTMLVWLFGDKTTTVCEPGLEYRVNGSHTDVWNGVIFTRDTYEWYEDPCFYKGTVKSRYTIPESAMVIMKVITSGYEWVASHPVI